MAGWRAEQEQVVEVLAGGYVTELADGFGRTKEDVALAVVAARPAAWVVQALAYERITRAAEPVARWQHERGQPGALRRILAADV